MLDAFAKTYIQSGLAQKQRAAESSIEFIEKELNRITDSLEIAEEVLERFRAGQKTINLTSEGERILEELFELEKQLAEEEARKKYYDYLKGYIESKKDFSTVVAPSIIGIQDPLLLKLISRLSELYAQRNQMGVNAREVNPIHFLKPLIPRSI